MNMGTSPILIILLYKMTWNFFKIGVCRYFRLLLCTFSFLPVAFLSSFAFGAVWHCGISIVFPAICLGDQSGQGQNGARHMAAANRKHKQPNTDRALQHTLGEATKYGIRITPLDGYKSTPEHVQEQRVNAYTHQF